jgi:hypothetical protein
LLISFSQVDDIALSGYPEISSGEGTLIQRAGQVKDMIIVLPALVLWWGVGCDAPFSRISLGSNKINNYRVIGGGVIEPFQGW